MVFINSVSRPDIQPLILNKEQIETVKEYTRIWELYLHQIESLQGPKEHWQCKQRKSYTSYERLLIFKFPPVMQCHVQTI